MIMIKPKTAEQMQQELTSAIQQHLDATAQANGYDSIISACSYAGYPNPFQEEAIAYGIWRGDVWNYAYEQLALVGDGTRAIPTVDEFILELPKLGAINE